MTYTYDALGRQIGVDTNGTQRWTVYNGSSTDANAYADYNGSGGLTMRYLYGLAVDEILARTDPSANTSWYITDKLGTVEDVVSSSGSVSDHILYDSFGNITTETNATAGDRFKFAGMEWDSTTGLYYDRARYYDPNTGRFVSQDPKGFAAGDTNLYRYVANSPTLATDSTGLDITPKPPPNTPSLIDISMVVVRWSGPFPCAGYCTSSTGGKKATSNSGTTTWPSSTSGTCTYVPDRGCARALPAAHRIG